jgi:hypothetical protein
LRICARGLERGTLHREVVRQRGREEGAHREEKGSTSRITTPEIHAGDHRRGVQIAREETARRIEKN